MKKCTKCFVCKNKQSEKCKTCDGNEYFEVYFILIISSMLVGSGIGGIVAFFLFMIFK